MVGALESLGFDAGTDGADDEVGDFLVDREGELVG